MTEEMGKTVTDGRAEIEKCAFNCDWFADHAQDYMAREPVDLGGPEAFVTFNPIGVVLAVMPWNFPFWQVFRFAAPALMAGNAIVLKIAPPSRRRLAASPARSTCRRRRNAGGGRSSTSSTAPPCTDSS